MFKTHRKVTAIFIMHRNAFAMFVCNAQKGSVPCLFVECLTEEFSAMFVYSVQKGLWFTGWLVYNVQAVRR